MPESVIRAARDRGATATHVAMAVLLAQLAGAAASAEAQAVTYRGMIEAKGTAYPQEAANDPTQLIGDLRARAEVFVKPVEWLQLAAGIEGLANSYDQVGTTPAVNLSDRGVKRPALSVRRASVTLSRGPLTVDLGKQFVRWGKADIVTPTDRFAPRDFLNVIDAEFLAVRAGRVAWTTGTQSLEGVVSIFTPSRTPLLDQRWTVAPPGTPPVRRVDGGSLYPTRPQAGVRWSRTGRGYDYALAFFDGFNHLPNIGLAAPVSEPPQPGVAGGSIPTLAITRSFPTLRMFGGDVAVPTPWVTLKAELAHFGTRTADTDEFVLYVLQLERQTGEWLLVGGYAGEWVTAARSLSNFAPDRGAARAFVGRASYTIDAVRSAAVEAAVRQNGDGVYLKGELSRASGRHWRTTIAGAAVRGAPDDFLGQFRLNSHLSVSLRYSF